MNRTPRISTFLWCAAGLIVAFVAVYLFFVRTYTGQIVDERAFNGAADQHSGIAAISEAFLTFEPYLAFGLGAVLTVGIALAGRRFRHLVVAVLVVGVAVALAELSKYLFLSRPETGATNVFDNSFPSGHTTVAAAAAFAVFVVTAPRWRPLAAVLGGGFAVLTGVLALISQWHRPSDVVAAYFLVAACGCLAGAVLVAWGVPSVARPCRGLQPLWWIAGVSALVSLIAFIVIYATTEQHGRHLEVAYIGGSFGILAAGAALTAAGNRLFRRVG
ncbi:phosphatase PAP2 family protein [Rathayibacter sp. CAU 1779]